MEQDQDVAKANNNKQRTTTRYNTCGQAWCIMPWSCVCLHLWFELLWRINWTIKKRKVWSTVVMEFLCLNLIEDLYNYNMNLVDLADQLSNCFCFNMTGHFSLADWMWHHQCLHCLRTKVWREEGGGGGEGEGGRVEVDVWEVVPALWILYQKTHPWLPRLEHWST